MLRAWTTPGQSCFALALSGMGVGVNPGVFTPSLRVHFATHSDTSSHRTTQFRLSGVSNRLRRLAPRAGCWPVVSRCYSSSTDRPDRVLTPPFLTKRGLQLQAHSGWPRPLPNSPANALFSIPRRSVTAVVLSNPLLIKVALVDYPRQLTNQISGSAQTMV